MRALTFLLLAVVFSMAGVYQADAQIVGGSGTPLPSWGHKKKGQSSSTKAANETLTADGIVMSNDGKKLLVATEDGRTLTLKLNPQTKFTRQAATLEATAVVTRTTVHIEADVDDEGFLTATTVNVTKDAPALVPGARAARAQANGGTENEGDRIRPTILNSPGDAPGRPILRHGKPAKSEAADDDPSDSPTPSKQTSVHPEDPAQKSEMSDFTIAADDEKTEKQPAGMPELVGRTKHWTEGFTNGLPNYVCRQVTTRYQEQSKSSGWQPIDVVTATVIYEDGRESYRDITVGGKKTDKNMRDLGGSTSTGEFGSTLRSLFSDFAQAQFKPFQSSTIGQTAVTIFDFKVALKHSDWTIIVGGQALVPAYSGSVWVDRSTAEVRRIEMSANNIPKDFPLDTIEWAVDYDMVSLGTSKFLLPVHAEMLGCQRASTVCTKNAVDFRDYHRYAGESTITFQ